MTAGQREVLEALADAPHRTTSLVNRLHGYPHTYNSVHASLRRMEDDDWVRRTYPHPGACTWELTHTGRQALEQQA